MSIFFFDSMAHYTTNAQEVTKWSANYVDRAPIAGAGAFGSPGLRGNNDSQGLQLNFSAKTTLEFSGYVIAAAQSGKFMQFANTDGIQISLWIYTDGTIRVDRGDFATELGRTAAAAFSFGVQHHLYLKLVFSDTVGVAQIKVDGVQVLNLTGQDTSAQTSANCTIIRLWGQSSSGQSDAIWSHIALADAAGDITGRPRVQALFADGAGNYSQWGLTGAGSYIGAIQETTPDEDTTYAKSGTVGQRSSATYSNVLPSTAVIKAVAVVPRGRTDDGASRTIKTFVRAGGVDYDHASAQSVPGSYGYLQQIYPVNPATGVAWTPTEVNAIEAGIKVES
jgi:hypothetical protein